MFIRKAKKEEAGEIAALLRRSITELCVEDHSNNPAILSLWVGGKTEERLSHWIENPQSVFYVAIEEQSIVGVGAMNREASSINLNYVSPDARFRGISKRLIQTMEEELKRLGCKDCLLMSTTTARRFYLALGYLEGPPDKGIFGHTVYPMHKRLGGER